MPQMDLKFGSDGALEPEDDDISNAYMLSRQVAHEYHSSATQSYINAESAAQQVANEAAMSEQDKFKKEQSNKQSEKKAAESSFTDTMVGNLQDRKTVKPKQPTGKNEQLISESTGIKREQMAKGEKLISEETGQRLSQEFKNERLISEETGKRIEGIPKELGGVEAPMIDPTQAAAAGMGASFKLSMSAGKALMPSLARAITAGVVNTVTDPLYGTAAEVVGAASPELALPFNLAVGLLGGMTLEPAIERGIVRAAKAAGRVLDSVQLAEQVQMMKGILANESGQVDVWHGSPKSGELTKIQKETFKQLSYNSHKESSGTNLLDALQSRGFEIIDRQVVKQGDRSGIERVVYKDANGVQKNAYIRLQQYDVDGFTEDSIISLKEIPDNHLDDFFKQAEKEQTAVNTATKNIRESDPDDVFYWIDKGRDAVRKHNEIMLKKHGGDFDKAYSDPEYLSVVDVRSDAEKLLYAYKSGIDLNDINDRIKVLSDKGKKLVSRESGGVVDDLTKRAVIEELNAEIGKHPVEDALRILKNQRGELVVRQGDEGTPPAPVKGGKSGTPKPGDMEAKSQEVLANTNPDITKETAGNIRLWGADLEPKFMGEIESPEDIMRVISGTHEAFADETEIARRGVRSWEETAAEAKKYKLEDLLGRKSGQALNAEQVDNARTMLVSSADTLRGMAQVVSRGEASDIQKADFMRAFNVHYAIQMQLSGAAAEAGRALNIFRKVATSDTLRVGQLKDFLSATADKKITPEAIAGALSTMTTPAQVANYVKQAKRATTWDMFIEAWINGLLSGPVTHAVNTVSNALTSVWMIPERALASGLSKLHGGDIRAGEVAAQAYGMITGAKDGFKLAWQALKTGEGSDIVGKIEQQQQRAISAENVRQLPLINKLSPNALEEGGIAARFVDVLGEAIRVPGRFLTAEDEFFKSIGYRMELHAQAFRTAAKEGLEGTAAAQRMQAIIADPQNLAPDVHLAAVDASRYQTFTSELGKGGKGIQAAANYIPGAKLVVPFIRTPANIMKFALERNLITAPFFKQVRADIMAGGARTDMALSRIAMGSMGMGVVATYAASGAITGGGPSDTDLRAHKYNTGWQPYSIKIGDTYYAYGRLEPLGMMMGLAADAVEIMGELDELESDKLATTIVAAIGKNVMSKTWLRGMSEMINAMEDPDRYGSKYVKQLAGTAVPTGVAQIERTLYPELSDAQSALDAIKARIPGYSNELPTRRNLWGEKIQFNGALGPDIISPIFTSKEKDSAIDKELLRMKAPIKMPSRTQSFEGVPIKLDANEYEEFMVRMNGTKLDITGKTLKKSLNELVIKDKDYKALKNDDHKERMIRAYMQEATEKTRAAMLEENQTLRMLVDDEHRRQAAAQ